MSAQLDSGSCFPLGRGRENGLGDFGLRAIGGRIVRHLREACLGERPIVRRDQSLHARTAIGGEVGRRRVAGLDQPRLDAELVQLVGQRLGEAFDRAFAGGIDRHKRHGAMAALDVTLMMTPWPCLRICGMMARQAANTPKVFVSNISRTVLSGVASTIDAMPIPALFTSTSMAPKAATPAAMALPMLSALVTSSGSTFSRSDVVANTVGIGPTHRGEDVPSAIEKQLGHCLAIAR